MTDADGHFTTEMVLPASLGVRPYEVRAIDSFGDTVSGYLTVDRTTSSGSDLSTSVVPGFGDGVPPRSGPSLRRSMSR